MLFRGREMQHQEEGRRVLAAILEKLAPLGKVKRRSRPMDGRKMTSLVTPNGKARPATAPAAPER